MKAYALFASIVALPLALADFHVNTLSNTAVSGPSSQQGWTSYVACPSNYWNCKCLTDGDRTGTVDGYPGDFFTVNNLCGMDQLNFYKAGDGHYDMYENDGNGEVIGTCYPNPDDHGKYCNIITGSTTVQGGMVCYSYVCN